MINMIEHRKKIVRTLAIITHDDLKNPNMKLSYEALWGLLGRLKRKQRMEDLNHDE